MFQFPTRKQIAIKSSKIMLPIGNYPLKSIVINKIKFLNGLFKSEKLSKNILLFAKFVQIINYNLHSKLYQVLKIVCNAKREELFSQAVANLPRVLVNIHHCFFQVIATNWWFVQNVQDWECFLKQINDNFLTLK